MLGCLLRLLRASGAPGEMVDAWLLAPNPFLDRDSPRCHTVRDQWVLGGGQKPECHSHGSNRTRDMDKSLAEDSHNATLLESMNQVRMLAIILSNIPPLAFIMVN